MSQLDRRRFLVAAGASLAAGLARSQGKGNAPDRVARIGFLLDGSSAATKHFRAALSEGLRARGWIEGRNLVTEARFADGETARIEPLARELVALAPDVIVAPTTAGAVTARSLTKSIPIVFVLGVDPVGVGLAQNLARPGGNVTGLSIIAADVALKRMEILREALPSIERVAVLHDPGHTPSRIVLPDLDRGAKAMGLTLERIELGLPATFDAAFSALERMRPDAALVLATPAVFIHRREIIGRLAKARVPASYNGRDFAMSGGLMSYAVDFRDNFRRAADYVDRILRGADPGELPIQQPTKFELLVNLKTARALGVEIPRSVLLRADQLIE